MGLHLLQLRSRVCLYVVVSGWFPQDQVALQPQCSQTKAANEAETEWRRSVAWELGSGKLVAGPRPERTGFDLIR